MTPPPSPLARRLRARLAAELAELREALAAHPDLVLVDLDPETVHRQAEIERAFAAHELLPPPDVPAAVRAAREALIDRRWAEAKAAGRPARVTLTGPGGMPPGLSLPLTAGVALDVAERLVPEMAEDAARIAEAMIAVLVPPDPPGLRAATLAAIDADLWPWPYPSWTRRGREETPTSRPAALGWEALHALWGDGELSIWTAFTGAWPDGVPPLEVAEWTRDAFNRGNPQCLPRQDVPWGDPLAPQIDWHDPVAAMRPEMWMGLGDFAVESARRGYLPPPSPRFGGSFPGDGEMPASAAALLFLAWKSVAWRYSPAVAARFAWEAVRVGSDAGPRETDAAREALKRAGRDPEDADARRRLAATLTDKLRELGPALGMDGDPPAPDEEATTAEIVPDVGPMLKWDATFARWLEATGAEGQTLAVVARDDAAERWREHGPDAGTLAAVDPTPGRLWKLWYEPAEGGRAPRWRFLEFLADALWVDTVAPRMAEERQRTDRFGAPALARVVIDAVASAALRRDREVRPAPERQASLFAVVVRTASGRTVGAVERVDVEALARRHESPVVDGDLLRVAELMETTSTVLAHKYLRHVVAVGHRQKMIERAPDFRKYIIPGGFAELARRLGVGPGKYSDKLRSVVEAFDLLRVPLLDGGYSRLVIVDSERLHTHTGRRAELHLLLSDPVLPGFMFDLPKGNRLEDRDARRLVPFPDTLPAFVGKTTTWGQQATLQVLVLEEMADRAPELIEDGGVRIDARRWEVLADEARLSRRLVPEIRKAWVTGGKDAPAFLAPLPGDRFDLAPAYEEARRVLEVTGRRGASGRRGGLKAAAIRRRLRGGGEG